MKARSCDTFVYVSTDGVYFGKNSDRPQDEVQNLVYVPRKVHGEEDRNLQCTYITIPQVPETYSCFLSQPHWMWGAEMGANEFGVVIGNEAIDTKEPLSSTKKLLGMDLLRLGLERGKSAKEATLVITQLLEKYGQGGDCAENTSWSYHNSFLIADCNEAYVLETADSVWAVEQITSGARNISNNMSINSNWTFTSDQLLTFAQNKGYWNGELPFNFAMAFSSNYTKPSSSWSSCDRESVIHQLLKQWNPKEDRIKSVSRAISILREHKSGVCMHGDYTSVASMVAYLNRDPLKTVYWFTGSPSPCKSFFKPLQFPTSQVTLPPSLHASKIPDEKTLWWAHQRHGHKKSQQLLELEMKYLQEVGNYWNKQEKSSFGETLFCQALEEEWNLLTT